MAYSAMVRRLLISSPSDITVDDLQTVRAAIERWNFVYGPQFGAVVLPVHWAHHAAPEHGVRPQQSLNRQLVADADGVLALFWHRLGSPTGEAVSGSVEEISEAAEAGKYVGILRCNRSLPGDVDTTQLNALRQFLADIGPHSLVLVFESEAQLAQHVDTILTQLVTRDQEIAHALIVNAGTHKPSFAQVHSRVEVEESVKTDAKGRLKPNRRWFVVLENIGTVSALDVRFRLELEHENDGELPILIDGDRPIESLAPRAPARYPALMHGGIAGQIRCVVSWRDDRGEQEQRSTLRFY